MHYEQHSPRHRSLDTDNEQLRARKQGSIKEEDEHKQEQHWFSRT